MAHVGALVALAVTVAAAASVAATSDVLDLVEPRIGTAGFGFGVGGDPPGPQVPFAAIRPSPDTSRDDVAPDFTHFGGYHYGDTHVRCFSQTHMVGPGVDDWGNVGVMAAREVTAAGVRDYGYRSAFRHAEEVARPAYVTLSVTFIFYYFYFNLCQVSVLHGYVALLIHPS